MVTAADDLAELKREQAALRATSERLQLFVEHAPAALAMFDREMRYIVTSRRWLADYGLDGRDILGQSHYAVFPEIPEAWRQMHRRGLAGEVVRCDHDRFVRADGTVQYLRWELLPWYAADGTVGGIVIFTEDTTQMRAAEEEVRRRNAILEQRVEARTAELAEARAQVESASLARSSFLANMSHEIRTPMNAILGLSHVLAEDLEHDVQSRDKLSKIGEAANHLLEIVSEALDPSAIDAGQFVPASVESAPVARRPAHVSASSTRARRTPGVQAELVRRYAGAEILLAEDNEVNREVARLLLGRAGLVVEAARDGREAVTMARAKRYALVLMDVQMPHMDGLEAAAVIRELPGWEEIPIVALTANALAEDRQRCLDAGMTDHLPKPVNPARLYQCLLQCLSGGA